MKSFYKRLIRPQATSIDRPGADEFSPPTSGLYDVGFQIAGGFAPNNRQGNVVILRANTSTSQRITPPPELARDAVVTVQTTYHARMRHGEGLWGIEPFVAEGSG